MSKWNHNICRNCWNKVFPNRGEPAAIIAAERETCCFCGKHNINGIYVRHNPDELLCKGDH